MSGRSLACARCVGKALLVVTAALCAFAARAAHAQQRVTSGWLHAIWVDPHTGRTPPAPVYVVIDDAGRWTRLSLDDATLRAAGGLSALDRRRVSVSGSVITSAPTSSTTPAISAMRVSSFDVTSSTSASTSVVASNPQMGSKPYVAILCRYSDSVAVPYSASVYAQWLGTSFPGVGSYWREISDGLMGIEGSKVVGWYTLPHPYSYYFANGSQQDPNFDALLNDCADAADADVDFTQFSGVILQFNGNASAAYGGSATLARDGQTKTYGVTWMPNWSTPATFAHEMGHTLGWTHSRGPYNQIYDSHWDVMSYPYGSYETNISPSTWVGEQTIALNKAIAGWIPASRILIPPMPSSQSVMLERSEDPTSGSGYLMLQIPMSGDGGPWYTAEARRFVGYDAHLPGEAVVLHTVDMTRPERAWVVDVDGNGDPNDAGAMWTPGETFNDSLNGITMTVDSETPTGFGVTVIRGWRLEMQAMGPGAITGSTSGSCTGRCSTVLGTRGQRVTLSATPNAGAAFTGWSGACSGTGACTLAMLGNRSVTAHFSAALTIASDSMHGNAVMGAPFADTLTATGGAGRTAWSVAKGALPAGLSLDSATGIVRGIPEAAGSYTVTITATRDSLTGSQTIQLTVVKPVLAAANVMDQLLGAATPLSTNDVRFLDLLGNRNGHLDVGDVRAWLIDTGTLESSHVASDSARVLDRAPTTPRADRTTNEPRHNPEQRP
ncbi:MAG TPA: putative Ig domain-containing protein [Gemmatimonadaceae bacterium]|nr:putative Ig domain-containing protein [Gemmatimonadaceae bacterium]